MLFIYKILFAIVLFFYLGISKLVLFFVTQPKKPKSILFLTAFFPGNAGYHWRAKEWFAPLEAQGYKADIVHAIEKDEFYKYKVSNLSLFHIKYLNKRFWQVIQSRKYEKVIVRRELLLYNEYGNLFLEKLLLKIHPNAILDFDDDIAFSKGEPREITSLYGKILAENGNKFTESLKLYNRFMVGSKYLKDYVLLRNTELNASQISVIPTCVNYESFVPKVYDTSKEIISFGWVGGNHNLFLLDSIIKPLNKISKKHHIELIVIAGKDYKNEEAQFSIINKKWSLETEIEDIKLMDIGLMPLLNTNRDKGKAGFKLIQYMGLGVVSIASNITVNGEIVDDKINGFLVDENWETVIEEVIGKKENFGLIGSLARQKIMEHYSFKANTTKYLNFIQSF